MIIEFKIDLDDKFHGFLEAISLILQKKPEDFVKELLVEEIVRIQDNIHSIV